MGVMEVADRLQSIHLEVAVVKSGVGVHHEDNNGTAGLAFEDKCLKVFPQQLAGVRLGNSVRSMETP
jgi:hypothetical protein